MAENISQILYCFTKKFISASSIEPKLLYRVTDIQLGHGNWTTSIETLQSYKVIHMQI